jgi:hypothetical protein
MGASLNYTLLLGAAVAAQLTLSACANDGDSDGETDGGTDQGDGGAGGDTVTDNDTGGNDDTDTLGIPFPFVASCANKVPLGATYTTCEEHYFEENADLEVQAQLGCPVSEGAIWSEERCPTAEVSGICKTEQQGDNWIVVVYNYGVPESDIAGRQTMCEINGEWITP